ncbi:unnamed protein product [Eruca vesicaria subsp. sativa]|uniref:Uncharacterized protein n=1 Tax=Eruca vesicaria subsp. sativa TaxID=29727 RepID=A0ABC8JJX7_ERUVS|nr:unnamed protein product [Eruca vesicaria subsp. sativa]
MPYMPPNTLVEQQYVRIPQKPNNVSGDLELRFQESRSEKAEDSSDVATQLELKTHGSTSDKDTSSQRPEKMKRSQRHSNNNNSIEGSSSSSSVAGGQKQNDQIEDRSCSVSTNA